MSAVQALKRRAIAGVRIGVDGDALTLEADAAPPPHVLDLLSRHKAEVIALLRTGRDGWSGEDWRAFFDERAGIAEFDGGLAARTKPRPAPSPAASPNGSTAIRCARRPAAASAAAKPTCPRPAAAVRQPRRPAMPGCIRAAGVPGTSRAKSQPSPLSPLWESRSRPSFQTISEKTGAHDGRLWIGTAERIGTKHCGGLPVD